MLWRKLQPKGNIRWIADIWSISRLRTCGAIKVLKHYIAPFCFYLYWYQSGGDLLVSIKAIDDNHFG